MSSNRTSGTGTGAGPQENPSQSRTVSHASSPRFSVYDGRDLVTVIRRHGRQFEARDAHGELIGLFATTTNAVAAIAENSA